MRDMPQLRTERLVLRPFIAIDGRDVERLAGERAVADTTLTIPHPYPPGSSADWIAGHREAWQRGDRLSLAICTREGGEHLMGAISLRLASAHRHGELGYWVGVDHWAKGYATEAAKAVTAYGFADLELHRVEGRHFVRNPASGRVLEKVGMRLEGVHRGACLRWGRFEDLAVYGILASEWDGGPAIVDASAS